MNERLKRKKFITVNKEEYFHPSRTKVPSTTVCKLNVTLKFNEFPNYWECNKEIDKFLASRNIYRNNGFYLPSEIEITVVGVAKLKQGDVFNENIGKKVAKAKANIKLYNICKNIQKICLKHIVKQGHKTHSLFLLFLYLEENEREYITKEKYEIRDRQ